MVAFQIWLIDVKFEYLKLSIFNELLCFRNQEKGYSRVCEQGALQSEKGNSNFIIFCWQTESDW